MPIETTADPKKQLIVMCATDRVSDQDFAASFDEYLELRRRRPDFALLVDLREGALDMEPDAWPAVVERIESRRSDLGSGYRVAIVAPKDVDFGMSRIYQARSDHDAVETEVFRCLEDALRWLSEGSAAPLG